jgi:uncharacterized protein with NAD-binding domain and iron-sulfur cluster
MRVAIMGGGMAGLAAAWALSEPGAAPGVDVTVYQRGWRLGGKGASSRGVHGRIEEHGLHVWLGYYHNAFRLMREVYAELDRRSTAPGCPITSCDDAFLPAGRVGVAEQGHGHRSTWVATFADDGREPGTPGAQRPLTVAGFVRRSVRLLLDLSLSLNPPSRPPPPGIVLSASPRQPGTPRATAGFASLADLGAWARRAEAAAVVAATTAAEVLGSVPLPGEPLAAAVVEHLDRLRGEWTERIRGDEAARRMWQVAGLVLTCARGALRDGLASRPDGWAAIDHLDFRAWLARHGATPDVIDSPLVRGMYDLVFAYQEGDRRRPRFAAGLGLFLASKFFFEYTGSIFFKMRAGMGEVVFAPLYQALRARGVRFEFFHRLDQLQLSEDRGSVARVRLARQVRLADGLDAYQPLVDVGGLPCFPARPDRGQLAAEVPENLESHWADRRAEEPVTLTAGADFDAVVLATSLGMVPHVCGELLADSPRWRDLVAGVPTVATQAAQLWLRASDSELGLPPGGPTVSGLASSFETYAAMAQVLDHERWPANDRPASVAYLCGTLADEIAAEPATARAAVRRHAVEFLEHRAGDLWPGAVDGAGRFRWDLLAGSDGPASRLDGLYWTANVDPSDRYVQSTPGSLGHRLRADESGYRNLFLAGDWINCGLNAGCIEAAVMAGRQAANAVRGRELLAGVTGSWYGLEPTERAAS